MTPTNTQTTRRRWLAGVAVGMAGATALPAVVLRHRRTSGLGNGGGRLERVWGERGVSQPGRFFKPRAMTIDAEDRLYVVDMSARIQVFTVDGEFLRGWQTPAWENGKPTGLSIDRDGNLLVADTHYFRILTYSPDGKLIDQATLGGNHGSGPGQFGLVTDALMDAQGNLYVAEYGEHDRIQKFSAERTFLMQWGGHGPEPGQFMRPQNMTFDSAGRIWVADACNHRIQVFAIEGESARTVGCWGAVGSQPGQLKYPYDLVLDRQGNVIVVEFGNHRLQKFTRDGKWVASFGSEGKEPGQFWNPWSVVQDSQGRLHVADTYNHRIQRIRL